MAEVDESVCESCGLSANTGDYCEGDHCPDAEPGHPGGSRPWLYYELDDGYVWCTECGSEIYVAAVDWPDPSELNPGDDVHRWVTCYVEIGEYACEADVLLRRTVNDAGDGYTGPAVNDSLPGVDDGRVAVMGSQ